MPASSRAPETPSPFAIAAVALSRAAEEPSRGEVSTFASGSVSPLTDSRLRCASRLATSSPAMTGTPPSICWKRTLEREPPRVDSTRSSLAWSRSPNASACRPRNARAASAGGAEADTPLGRAMRRPAAAPTKRTAPVSRCWATFTPEPRSRRSAAARWLAAAAGAAVTSRLDRARSAIRIRFMRRSSPTPQTPTTPVGLTDDAEGLWFDCEPRLDLVADVVAVDVHRQRAPVDRAHDDLLDAGERLDLAMPPDLRALGERPEGDGRDVDRAGAREHGAREVAGVERRAGGHLDRVALEVRVGLAVLHERADAAQRLAADGDVEPRRAHDIAREERPHRRMREVPRAEARLQPRVAVDALDHAGVEAHPRAEHEAPVVEPAQVDAALAPGVGEPEQVLGGVDDVVGDPEHAAVDVGGAAGQAGQRRGRADESVGGLVDRPVAAERDHDVVALVRGLAAQLDRVPLGLGVDGLHVVAALQRIDHEVLHAVRHRRRVRVDDDQHAALAGLALEGRHLGEVLERRGCLFH